MTRFCLVLLAIITSACTFSGVKPDVVAAPPPTPPKTLVLGEVRVADPQWERHTLEFRRSIMEWFKRNGGFDSVLAERPEQPSDDSIVLLSSITEVDEGSEALRWFVGMGAGQAKVKGDFEIQNLAGATLAKFSVRESYLGGTGIGGVGYLSMDDLFRRFAESVAETTRKWAHGQAIQ